MLSALRYLLLCALVAPAQARQPLATDELPPADATRDVRLRFEHLTLEAGLSQGSIYGITQDRQGFLWFASQDGLNRYDGYRFQVFKSIPFDTTTLAANVVGSVMSDRAGLLWAGTGGGLDRLDPHTGRVTHFGQPWPEAEQAGSFQTVAIALYEDRSGLIWTGSLAYGLARLDPATGAFTRFTHDPADSTSLSNNSVIFITEDRSGTLWVSTSNGLNRYDPATESFTRYLHNPDRAGNDPTSITTGIFQDPSDDPNRMWVGSGYGLLHFDIETGTYTRHLPAPEQPQQNVILFVAPDPAEPGVYWMTLQNAGLARFDTRTKTFTRYRHDPDDPDSLPFPGPFSLYADQSGTLWAGSFEGQGLLKFDPAGTGFHHYQNVPGDPNTLADDHTWSVYVAPSEPDVLWVSTQGSNGQTLNRLDRATGAVTRYRFDPQDPNSIAPGNIHRMLEDRDGNFWIATMGGLNRMDRETGRFTRFRPIPGDSTSLSSNGVFDILEDRDGMLWVATMGGGLNRMDHETGRFTHFRHDPADSTSLSHNAAAFLFEDAGGALWIATVGGGLNRMDRETGRFTRFRHDPADPASLSTDRIMCVYERAREPGVLWVGTAGGGLNRFDTRTGRATHYLEQDGLANNYVYGILEDDAGHLWLSTNGGLSRFDPDAGAFANFDADDGIQGLEFNQGAFSRTARGELLFGGVHGVTASYPNRIVANPTPPRVVLTGLRLFNEPVPVGPDSPLRQPLSETREIRLEHWQNSLAFEYVGLHFQNPAGNRYAYRLEGFNDDWVQAGPERAATYTNLDPGTYTFRVRAASADGVWSDENTAVRLTILPPWWETPWFRLFAVVSVIGLVAGGYRQRVRQIQARNRRLEAQVAERTAALKEKNEHLEQNHAIVAAINAETSFRRLLLTILEQARVIRGVEKATALVYVPDVEAFVFRASVGYDEQAIAPIRLSAEEAEARYVRHAEEVAGDVFVAKDVGARPGADRFAGLDMAASFLVLRIRVEDRVEGYLIFDNMRDRDAFDHRDVALLEGLREHIRSAFIKTRLLEDLHRRNAEINARRADLQRTLEHLQRTQEQLVQQEKLASLGQLTAGIAHEIKNPLNFINNFALLSAELIEEIEEEIAANPDLRVADVEDLLADVRLNASKIAEHGRRADGIVRAMLEHSRGGKGERRTVHLNELVDEYLNLAFHGMRAAVPDFNCAVERNLALEEDAVTVIPQEIGRVLLNLLGNAFHAVHEKAKQAGPGYAPAVSVATCRTEAGVVIRVTDNGPGIPAAIRKKIFEPFFTTKPTGEGTGLGLSLSYESVVQGHQGTMTVESEVGQGTTFTVTLPG